MKAGREKRLLKVSRATRSLLALGSAALALMSSAMSATARNGADDQGFDDRGGLTSGTNSSGSSTHAASGAGSSSPSRNDGYERADGSPSGRELKPGTNASPVRRDRGDRFH